MNKKMIIDIAFGNNSNSCSGADIFCNKPEYFASLERQFMLAVHVKPAMLMVQMTDHVPLTELYLRNRQIILLMPVQP